MSAFRIFKVKAFERFAKKNRLSDDILAKAIDEIERGLIDADLGGGVVKKRVARQGEGKSGGFRTIIAYKAERNAFFLFGFAKSERDDIDDEELLDFRKLAKTYLELAAGQIERLLEAGELFEVRRMDKSKGLKVREPRAKYKSEIMRSIHESAAGLARTGAIDRKTMREFDLSCLTPVPEILPHEIIELREREEASQAVLAWFLNVSTSIVSQWERGKKRPSGAALKLLHLARAKGLDAIK